MSTHTVRKVKITAAQIIALRSAELQDDGRYVLPTAKTATLNALARIGVVTGPRALTVQGVSIMHTVRNVEVIASKGHSVYVSDAPESLAMFVLPARSEDADDMHETAPCGHWAGLIMSDGTCSRCVESSETDMTAETLGSVTVEGVDPSEFTPDFDASGAAECYFGCGVTPVAVFVDCVGRTEGLCGSHRDRVEEKTYDIPATAHTDTQEVPAHVFVPGMHALDMGAGAYNRFVGIGESQSVPGSLFTFGLATAISARPGMNGTGKINRECEFGDVIMVRTSLGDVQYVVADNRYGTDGPRKGDPILYPYALEDVKCYVCQVYGDNAAPGQNISGEWVCGFCLAFDVTPEKLNSHALSFYVETEGAGVKFDCDQCRAIDTRHGFGQIMCEGPWIDPQCGCERHANPSDVPCPDHTVTERDASSDKFPCLKVNGVVTHMGKCGQSDESGPWAEDETRRVCSLDDDTDAGFVETMVTKEYDLSVIVDETTGATVSLGWVTLTMNAAQCMDWDRVAEEYGRTHGTGKPRHGWASIITVHDVADI